MWKAKRRKHSSLKSHGYNEPTIVFTDNGASCVGSADDVQLHMSAKPNKTTTKKY